MAVTDLTGTTWVLNDTIDCLSFETLIGTYVRLYFISDNKSYISIMRDTKTNGIAYRLTSGTFNVYTIASGWGNEANKIISITGGTDATNTGLISWLEANGKLQQTEPTTPRKSIDLTTLAGWSALSDGSHSITIVAKADGYRDSEPSEAVTVKKLAPEGSYITFTGESSDFTLTATNKEWDGTVQYSTDKATWTEWDGSAISSSGQKLYLRGSGNTTFYTTEGARFVLSERAGCSGNLNTLLQYDNPPTELTADSCYAYMFYDCANLTTPPELPATTLTQSCYQYMFYKCTNLTKAPELPAMTLTGGCYTRMFGFCTSLTTAPALPATTLADACYENMFERCTSLTTPPALPATTLSMWCYKRMFYGCTKLTTIPALPATTLDDGCYESMFEYCTKLKVSETQTGNYQYEWRIPTSGVLVAEKTNWNSNMLFNTSGTFSSDPLSHVTYYVENEPVL